MAKKLFFIDDDTVFFYLIERACKKISSVVGLEFAESGEDALEKIKFWSGRERDLPDLMFVDVNMPQMDGFEFLNEFRGMREKLEQLQKISPIVMLTSSQHGTDQGKAIETGIVDRFVVKPPDMEGMGQLIREFTE